MCGHLQGGGGNSEEEEGDIQRRKSPSPPPIEFNTQTYMRITALDFKMQDHLKNEKNTIRRQLFARFRTGSHWLQVQVGRFKGAPRETRICEQCSLHEVEDEEHFLLKCSRYENIRARYGNMFPCVSLEAFFKKDQVLIANYIVECHEIHGCSSIH